MDKTESELMSKALDTFGKVLIAYAKRLETENDALVPLTDHAKYTDLTYRQLHRMIQNGTLVHIELPFTAQLWVRRSDLIAARPAPVGRPTKHIE